MATVVENFGSIIDNFSSNTQKAVTSSFEHLVKFTGNKVIKNGNSIIPQVTYSGGKLSKDLTAMQISTGNSYSRYTNYEKIEIDSIPKVLDGLTDDQVVFTYAIDSITQDPASNRTVSFDPFEKIDPNYDPDELEFKILGADGYGFSIVFAKAPPAVKLRSPELFNNSIRDENSFWSYSASNLTEVCESSLIGTNERIVYIRQYRNHVIDIIESGDFKKLSLTSLGLDGRHALYSDVISEMADNGVELEPDSNGYVHNELMYAFREDNTVIDISKISKNNKLLVTLDAKTLVDTDSSQITITLSDTYGDINKFSGVIVTNGFSIEDVHSVLTVQGKVASNDLTVSTLSIMSQDLHTADDPALGGKYAPPAIYMQIVHNGGNDTINTNLTSMRVDEANDFIFGATSYKPSVYNSKIWTSIDGSPFVNSTTATLTGEPKYGTHVFRAYVKGDGDIADSIVVEKTFTILHVTVNPIIHFDLVGGIATASIESDRRVMYSTDGAEPDLNGRTNSAIYTRPFAIDKKTVIKAMAIYDDGQVSDLVEMILDPDTLYTVDATLPALAVTGPSNPDGFTGAALVTFTNYDGIVYYTLNGSDPLDPLNVDRRVYVEPFNVLPIGSKEVTLHYGIKSSGKRSVSTYTN